MLRKNAPRVGVFLRLIFNKSQGYNEVKFNL